MKAWAAAYRGTSILRDHLGGVPVQDPGHANELELLQPLLDISLSGIVVHEAGTIRVVNRRIVEMFGYSEEELVGESALRFAAPESIDEVWRQIGAKRDHTFKFEGLRKDGSTFQAEARSGAFRYQGRPARIASLRDVTAQHAAETQLFESETKYEILMDKARVGVSMMQRDRLVYINQAAADMIGYTPTEALDLPLETFTTPETVTTLLNRAQRRADGEKEPSVYEIELICKDGTLKQVEVTAAPVQYKGSPANMGVLRDITEAKRSEHALRESEEHLRRLNEVLEHRVDTRTSELSEQTTQLSKSRRAIDLVLSTMPNLMFVYDSEGRFSAFYAREDHPDLIVPPSEFLGKHYSEILPPDTADQTRLALRELRETGNHVTYEYSIETPEGRIHFEATVSSIADSEDVLAVVSNITKRKQSEAQLVRMEKMAALGQLLAGVAHEINNPVNFIYGNLSLISDACSNVQKILQETHGAVPTAAERDRLEMILGTPEPAEFFSDMKGIVRDCTVGVRRVRAIVQSLRSFAHPDRDRRVPTDVRQCLDNTLTLLSHELSGRIQVVRDFTDVKPVNADPAQLNQVFTNLLLNAAQSMDGPGEITIGVTTDRDEVVVAVRDTGSGISESDRDRIFEPFFTTKELGQGTGLGLAICYSIVEAHGGRIQLTSTAGRGSTFTVHLPVGG
jgi:PAS domain S-box-containing protein